MSDRYCIGTFTYGRLTEASRRDTAHNPVTSTSYGYDAQGCQFTVTDSRNGATTYNFNAADQIVTATTPDPGGGPQVTTTFYDNMGRVSGTRNQDATTATNSYSPTGLLCSTSGGRTYAVGYGYDAQGRLFYMTNWQNSASSGSLEVTRWNYDSCRGWLASKDYPDPTTGYPPAQVGSSGPAYEYTAGARLSRRTWRRGIVTDYTYGFSATGHGLSDLVGVAYSNDPANTRGVAYTYDRQGRRSYIDQGRGSGTIVTTLAYDDANEPLSESNSGPLLNHVSVTSGYDNSLRRTSLAAQYSTTPLLQNSFAYDSLTGRLLSVNNGVNSAVYSYLANSPLVSQISFQSNNVAVMTTTKQYDYLNRLQSISSVPQVAPPVSFAYSYNSANQRIRTTLGDGSYWVYTYDSLGQVTSGKRFWMDGTPVGGQQYKYTFDDIGNRKSAAMGGDANYGPLRPAAYTANRLNQYSQRTVPSAVDILGIANPTANVTVNSVTVPYRKGEYFDYVLSTPNTGSYPWYGDVTVSSLYSPGQTTSGTLFVPKSPESFTPDADGNLSQDGHWIYAWDAENRLISLTPSTTYGPQISIKFEYDWQGRRIHKQVWDGANWTGSITNDVQFVYDGWNLIAELDALHAFTLLRSYTWGSDLSGSRQGAGGVGGLLEVTYCGTQTTNCFLAYDGNGNVAALADTASTNILAQYEYGPFGEVIRATGPVARTNPFHFSTKYQDDETDLLYYGYRYYSPSTGRWLSRDPLSEAGGPNLYAFVQNDMIARRDALGLAEPPSSGSNPDSKPCCDHSCDTEGARQITGVAAQLLPGNQGIGQRNAVDARKEVIKKLLGVCRLDPEHLVEAPSAEYLLDQAAEVAKKLDVERWGVSYYTIVGYRTCLKGNCGGREGRRKQKLGLCSPFHWVNLVSDPIKCKPTDTEAHGTNPDAFSDDATARQAEDRCTKDAIDHIEHPEHYV